ncbi:MAG: M3 family oligoendopeptidase, partial [Bacteroidia bacterium]|nr:M3 family oligoendopeptidase [Bacteroidia bacterium]
MTNLTTCRQFFPNDFKVLSWETLAPFYEELLKEEFNSLADFYTWIKKCDELKGMVDEERAWRFIRKTCNIADEKIAAEYTQFMTQIHPNVIEKQHLLDQKFYNSPFRNDLAGEEYQILAKRIAKNIELFRSENLPLITEVEIKGQEYDEVNGSLTIQWENRELTLQQASALLESKDRNLREKIWFLVANKRLEVSERIDTLFTRLVELRTQIAFNAGYSSFSDYKFKELGRFDYTKEDCFAFHEAVETVVSPIYESLLAEKAKKLNLPSLRPWDLSVSPEVTILAPFQTGKELIQKTIAAFGSMKPEFAEMLSLMKEKNFLDLDSRVGKAPGAYNYPLVETGIPFIFMNAAGTQGDVSTMFHEAGHAIHSFLTRDIPLIQFRHPPMEVAELASMSMELMSMDYWTVFYDTPELLKQAKREQMYRTLSILPWVATVDCFQHWIYDNPNHTVKERNAAWISIYKRFYKDSVDWSGLDNYLSYLWHKQSHIFDLPFYYIEYGIAQLGAFQLWKLYKQSPERGLQLYQNALNLGYTKNIRNIYEAAGIEMNFSPKVMQSLFDFVLDELKELDSN